MLYLLGFVGPHQEEALGARRVRVVLQWRRPEVGVHHVAGLGHAHNTVKLPK